MSIETQPIDNNTEQEKNSRITFELITYVFECMPNPGHAVPIEQVAEDLEETPDTILAVMDELRCDRLLDYVYDGDSIIVTQKDQDFLHTYTTYSSYRY